MTRFWRFLVLALLVWSFQTDAALAARVALIIGNKTYAQAPLNNSENDARRMEEVLKTLGFRVEVILNADRSAMQRGLNWLSQNSIGADTAAIFYSGHGIEINGQNYLIPVGASIFREEDVPNEAVALDGALHVMNGAQRLKLAFIDACRDNRLFPMKGGSKGLGPQAFRASRMIMSFATQPGHVAYDGAGDLSPFTQSLAETLERDPHGDLRKTLTELEARVRQLTPFDQSPRSEATSDFGNGEHVSITGEQPQGVFLDACSSLVNLSPGQRCIRHPDGTAEIVTDPAPPPGGQPPPGGSVWSRPPASVRQLAGEPRLALTLPHEDLVFSVAFNSDGSLLLTGSEDRTARIWYAATGSEIGRLPHVRGVRDAVFSLDGARIATVSGEDSARIWSDPSQAPQRLAHGSPLLSIAFSPDGGRVITGALNYSARIWDLASGKALHSFRHENSVRSVAFSPDGRIVLTGSDDGTARLWDAASGQEIRRLLHLHLSGASSNNFVFSAVFSPDGRLIGTGTDQGKAAHVWDAQSGGELYRLPHGASVSSVAFSPDNRHLLTGSADTTARVWDAASGQELYRLPHGDPVLSVAFSPDGKRALTGSQDGKAYLWDLP